jgi:hypothetical protein
MKKLFLSFLLIHLINFLAYPQQNITTSGGNANGSGGSASYAVGQTFYSTHSGSTGTMSEGVQQPFEISVVNSTEDAKHITLDFMAYPNPTREYLTLKGDFRDGKITWYLYDLSAKLHKSEKVTETESSIYMGDLVPGVYILRLTDATREVKVFRIIKN